ncbi:MAG TPA: DUF4337 family protein [Candidatus Dormibacteraeota bacterium]
MEANEAMEHAQRTGEQAARGNFGRHVAILVAVLAALLAIATLLGNQATADAILSQERATDTFSEYQADSVKEKVSADSALILRQLGGEAAARAAADLERTAASEAAKRRPLLPLARSLEAQRDTAEHRHHGYQFAEAALQIAIVLASVSIVARSRPLVCGSLGLGVLGVLFILDGATQLVWLG